MSIIYLIRHGESVGNFENRFRGRHDFPLNENGLEQARALKKALQNIDFRAIYSSPLSRAFQTAEILADGKLPVNIHEGFNNISLGPWENRRKEEIQKKYPDLWQVWKTQPERLSVPGMESLQQVRERSFNALKGLIAKHPQDTIAVVTHRAVLKPLFAAVLDMPEPYFWKIHIDTAAYAVLQYHPERGFTFMQINQNAHLRNFIVEDLG